MANQRSFFAELKQRHVMRAAIIYAAAVWALAQGISQLSPAFDLSTGVTFWFVIACVIGFPFWLAFAWFFKFTSSGIVREDETVEDPAAVHRAGRILDYWIIGIMAVAIVLLLTNQLILQRGKTIHEFAAVTPTAHAAAKAPVSFTAASTAHPTAASIAAQPIPAKSVAVLPFENLSADKNNAYFADGMQDLILTKLADIGDLKVISRTSTIQYGSHPENLKTVGQQLGVATILEGSVQKAGKQVLINVQLIDAKTDSHIWAESYTRTLDNIFGVEGEVADKVAKALNAKLTAAEAVRVNAIPTTNQAAYNAYLRGEYYWNHTELPDYLEKAAGYYRKAVAQDPKFALAWARLSQVLSLTAGDPQFSDHVKQALAAAAPAKAALDHALALAPDSLDTQLAKGWYLEYVEKDQTHAQAAFEAVLATQPNNAQAWRALGILEGLQGQWQQALENFEKASTLSPRDPEFLKDLSYAQMELRHYPQAVLTARRWVALDPAGEDATTRLLDAYKSQGDFSGAEAALEAAPAGLRDSPDMILLHAELKMLQRDFNGARQLLSSLKPSADMPLGFIALWRGKNALWAGNTAQARQYFSQSETQYKATAGKLAGAGTNHIIFGLLDAGMGRAADTLQQLRLAQRARAARKSYNTFHDKVLPLWFEAQTQATLGNADAAVKALDQLLAMPAGYLVSVPLLKLSPMWDPIRHDPAFQALLKKYGTASPAHASTATPAHVASGSTTRTKGNR